MKRISFLVTLFIMTWSLLAQDLDITGTVLEYGSNLPLTGVTVKVNGKQVAASTNSEGKYAIKANQGDELVYTYIGMETIMQLVTSQTIMNITMHEDYVALDQVVVIGYGTVKKSDLTGAVSSVSAKDLQTSISTNPLNALQGRLAGVRISNSTGQPGSGMNIEIRGAKNTGTTPPLYVIDGVYGEINLIDPADIESIEILKDASAASIYGSRAAFGVVLITTKSGRKNTPSKIALNFSTGIQQMPKTMDVMNGEEWARTVSSVGGFPGYQYPGVSTDWQDEMYRTAAILRGNVGISGGSETSTHSTSVGYTSQEGIMINTGYEAINLRLKNDFSFLNNRLTIGESIIFKTSKQDLAPSGALVHQALRMPPTIPVHDEERLGGWAAVENWMTNIANPIGDIYANSGWDENSSRTTDFLFNGHLSLNILDGLTYKMNLSMQRNNSKGKSVKGLYDFGPAGRNDKTDIAESSSNYDSWMLENTLNYDKSIGKHNIYGLLGYSAEKNTTRSMSGSMQEIPLGVESMTGGSAESESAGSGMYRSSTASMFARLMYSFDSRYLFSASIRRDGSSRLAPGHQWNNFPSLSAGWNIHNESFAESITSVVDELKIRASYGTLGNQNIGNYLYQSRVTSGINYVQGNTWWMGAMPGTHWISPENLKWETSETTNIGLDLILFKGKLRFTADAFITQNKDILLGVPMPPSVGLGGSLVMNAGTFENKGLELSLSYRNSVDKVFYTLSGNATFLKNNMRKITVGSSNEIAGYNPQGLGIVSWARIGRPISGFYLVETNGIFQTNEEVQAHKDANGNILQPDAEPGDIRFIDLNNDGKIDQNDSRYMGSGIPKVNFGFRANAEWNDFDIGFFFDGVLGNKLYNNTRYRLESMVEKLNHGKTVLDAWTPTNTDTSMPRFQMDNKNINSRVYSDRWLENGAYLRLKSLDVGYTLPKTLIQKIKLDNVRVFTSFENLFVITAYKGYTPDLGASDGSVLNTGVDQGRYPMPRIMALGIQINL